MGTGDYSIYHIPFQHIQVFAFPVTNAHRIANHSLIALPIVSIDRDFGPQIPIVGSNHVMGGRLAAELMLCNHCKKVLQISALYKMHKNRLPFNIFIDFLQFIST